MMQLRWKTEQQRQELHERSLKNIRARTRMEQARVLFKGMAHLDLDEIPPGAGEQFHCSSAIRDQADVESIIAAVATASIPKWLNRRRLRLDIDRIIRSYVVLERVGPQQPRDELRRAYGSLAHHARRIRELFDDLGIGVELTQELARSFPAHQGQHREGGGCEKAPSLSVLRAGLRRLERRAVVRSAKETVLPAGLRRLEHRWSAKVTKLAKKKGRQQSAMDWLLGTGLRQVFERWFQQQRPVKVSQSRTVIAGEADTNAPPKGVYIDFALAVLQEKNIKNPDGSPISRGTVYVAVRSCQAAEKRSKTRTK